MKRPQNFTSGGGGGGAEIFFKRDHEIALVEKIKGCLVGCFEQQFSVFK